MISKTSDPLPPNYIDESQTPIADAWDVYLLPTLQFPDYPKLSIYRDYYTVCTNESIVRAYIFTKAEFDNLTPGSPISTIVYGWQDRPYFAFDVMTPITSTPSILATDIEDNVLYFARTYDINAPNANPVLNVDYVETYKMSVTSPTTVDVIQQNIPISPFSSDINGYTAFSGIPSPGGTSLDPLREPIMNFPMMKKVNGTIYWINSWVTRSFPDTSFQETGIRWLVLKYDDVNEDWSNHQEGTIIDYTNELYYWMPSIGMDDDGYMLVVFSGSSPTNLPSMYCTGKPLTSPVFPEPFVLTDGLADVSFTRWGDYFSCTSPSVNLFTAAGAIANERANALIYRINNPFFTVAAGSDFESVVSSWVNPGPTVTKYILFRDNVEIFQTTDTSIQFYQDENLKQNTEYKYKLVTEFSDKPDEESVELSIILAPPNLPPSTSTNIRVVLFTDNLPLEISWKIRSLPSNNIVLSSPVYDKQQIQYLSDTLLLPGDYTFEIFDAGGNGICCANGDGYYNVKLLVGGGLYIDFDPVVEGGQFGFSELSNFTVPDINLRVGLLTDQFPAETSWEIRNANTNQILVFSPTYSFPSTGFINFYALPFGDYIYEIFDSFGDGICCAFGEGEYKVQQLFEGKLYDFSPPVIGGQFGFSESTCFTLGPGFSLEFEETSVVVCQPDNAVYEFNYVPIFGFDDETTFSTQGLNPLLTAVFSPPTATDATLVTLTVEGTDNVPPSSYSFVAIGTSGSLEIGIELELVIFSTIVAPPILVTPVNKEFGVAATYPLLECNNDVNVVTYLFELSTDKCFNDIIFSESVLTNSIAVPGPLNTETKYFWRVTGINQCNEGAVSEVWRFTTLSCKVYNGGTDIPIEDRVPISDTLTVPVGDITEKIEYVVVKVDILHTWVSDLVIDIEHNGTNVVVWFGNCGGNDDLLISFRDGAPSISCNLPIEGTFQPVELLIPFKGMDASGDWTLNIIDRFNGGRGLLKSWNLEICYIKPDLSKLCHLLCKAKHALKRRTNNSCKSLNNLYKARKYLRCAKISLVEFCDNGSIPVEKCDLAYKYIEKAIRLINCAIKYKHCGKNIKCALILIHKVQKLLDCKCC